MNLLRTLRTVSVFKCPFKNLLIREADDEIETVVYEPTGSVTDSDDVKVSNIQLGVVRCSHTAVRDEDWRRSNVFHTYVTGKRKKYKIMIDGGSFANIIAKITLEKMGLKVEPHPHSYNVNWVDKLLNLLPSIVRSLSTCLAARIVFGVMS